MIEEVRKAVFEMAPYKAPGPDGFPAGFYQKSWDTVGQSLFELVNNFITQGIVLEDLMTPL